MIEITLLQFVCNLPLVAAALAGLAALGAIWEAL